MTNNIPYTRKLANITVDENESGLAGGWDMINVGTSIIDQSGNSHNGIINSEMSIEYGLLGRQIRFTGSNGYIDIGDISANCNTISFWIKPNNLTDQLIDLDGGTHTISLSGGVITATGFDSPTIYVNGIAASNVVLDLSFFVVITTETGFSVSDLDIGRIGVNYSECTFMGSVKIFNTVKSATWVSEQYRIVQQQALWATASGIDISTADISGGHLENTPFRVPSGSFRIVQSSFGGQQSYIIRSITAGNIVMNAMHFSESEIENANGEFEFYLKKGASANQPGCMFISDKLTDPVVGGNNANGYGLFMNTSAFRRVLLSEITNGVLSFKFFTNTNYVDAQDTWYGFRIRRERSWEFKVYISGGIYPKWTLIDTTGGSGTNPFTDGTTKTSYKLSFKLDSGDEVLYSNPYGSEGLIKKVLPS